MRKTKKIYAINSIEKRGKGSEEGSAISDKLVKESICQDVIVEQ